MGKDSYLFYFSALKKTVKLERKDHIVFSVIHNDKNYYYTGSDGENDVRRAHRYHSPTEAHAKLRELSDKQLNSSISCIILDEAFDYFNGEKFVTNLSEAKFYSVKEAEEKIRHLA